MPQVRHAGIVSWPDTDTEATDGELVSGAAGEANALDFPVLRTGDNSAIRAYELILGVR
jgi:hypothetical protein